ASCPLERGGPVVPEAHRLARACQACEAWHAVETVSSAAISREFEFVVHRSIFSICAHVRLFSTCLRVCHARRAWPIPISTWSCNAIGWESLVTGRGSPR